MSTSWVFETRLEAFNQAANTIATVADHRSWSEEDRARAGLALSAADRAAEDGAEGSGPFFELLGVAWKDAAGPVRPAGWDSLGHVWSAAADTAGAAVDAARLQSVRVIVADALAASAEDASDAGEAAGGFMAKLLDYANKHPVRAAGITGLVVLGYKVIPLALARALVR